MTSALRNAGTAGLPGSCRVLVVEDDQTTRSFLLLALARRGYVVAGAEDVASAQETLSPSRIRTFECVLADYRLPDKSGLDLLAWIQKQDPSLATIVITAEGEKELVSEALRGGAAGFLDKPVTLEDLHATIAQAVERTRRQRRLTQSEHEVQELGRAQEWMLGAEAARSAARMEVCFHPKHAAGGDFFSQFRPGPGQFLCLLTDVSGHDLQAAFVSAYFHGIVRGMLERAAPMEEVFATFNRLLIEEWSQVGVVAGNADGILASVAACAMSIDATAQTATVLAHGTPAPVYWLPNGAAKVVGETGGFPLGWFSEVSARGVAHSIAGGGSFCLWTDGLEEVAQRIGVSELNLAGALQSARNRRARLAEIDSAADDILVVDLHVSSPGSVTESFRPVILEEYRAEQTREIDELQALWRRSLALALPELPEASLHDVLLASREMLLNALRHGCRGIAGQKASFQVSHCLSAHTVRVRVDDPGPGHHFDLAEHKRLAAQELISEHRGLILVDHLATRMIVERDGASVTMDFAWA